MIYFHYFIVNSQAAYQIMKLLSTLKNRDKNRDGVGACLPQCCITPVSVWELGTQTAVVLKVKCFLILDIKFQLTTSLGPSLCYLWFKGGPICKASGETKTLASKIKQKEFLSSGRSSQQKQSNTKKKKYLKKQSEGKLR